MEKRSSYRKSPKESVSGEMIIKSQRKEKLQNMNLPKIKLEKLTFNYYQCVSSIGFAETPSFGVTIKCLKRCVFKMTFMSRREMLHVMRQHFIQSHKHDFHWNGFCSRCEDYAYLPESDDKDNFTLMSELKHITDRHMTKMQP